MSSFILTIEFVPTIIAIVSGIILAFLAKPTMKYFCFLLFLAGMFYGIGLFVEYLTDNDSPSENFANGYNRSFFWVIAFMLASVVVIFRIFINSKKMNR